MATLSIAERVCQNFDDLLQKVVGEIQAVDKNITAQIVVCKDNSVYFHLSGGRIKCLSYLVLENVYDYEAEKAREICEQIGPKVKEAIEVIYRLPADPANASMN